MLFCNEEDTLCAIFEVLSPSTALKDKTVKKAIYQKAGVKEYFLVNAEYKIVEKFELIDKAYELGGIYGVDDKIAVECLGLEIELKEIFEV